MKLFLVVLLNSESLIEMTYWSDFFEFVSVIEVRSLMRETNVWVVNGFVRPHVELGQVVKFFD